MPAGNLTSGLLSALDAREFINAPPWSFVDCREGGAARYKCSPLHRVIPVRSRERPSRSRRFGRPRHGSQPRPRRSKSLSKHERVANLLSGRRVNDNAAANGTAGSLRQVVAEEPLVAKFGRSGYLPYPGGLGDSMHFHDEIRVISCFFAEAVVRDDERRAWRDRPVPST
jgi:hypothetical protein